MLNLKKSEDLKYNPLFQPELIILEKETTSFGRSAELVDVVVDSSLSPRMISRIHAKILRKDDHFVIECDSLNGVLVNSVKRKKSELQDGDLVVFGGAGAKTSEGTVVTKNSQSELVYVFQTQQKCGNTKRKAHFKSTEIIQSKNYCANEDKALKVNTRTSFEITDSKGVAQNNCHVNDDSVERTSPIRISREICDKADIGHIKFTESEMFECSPGEGTSDGIVKFKNNVMITEIASVAADDIKNTHDYKRCCDVSSLQDDKEGFVFKRRKKRSRMLFDSDEESEGSPDRKLLKKDSKSKIEGLKERQHLQSEISKNKVFLDDLNEELLCCICRELMVLTHALSCSHTFCYMCIRNWLRESPDCPSCRSKATFNNLVPVKVLDNMVDKVAEKVLNADELQERQVKIQELQARINGRMEENSELCAEYGDMRSDKGYCEKCNFAISNRLLRWVVGFPTTSSTASYHFKCFKPPKSTVIDQIKIANEISKTDLVKIKTVIKK